MLASPAKEGVEAAIEAAIEEAKKKPKAYPLSHTHAQSCTRSVRDGGWQVRVVAASVSLLLLMQASPLLLSVCPRSEMSPPSSGSCQALQPSQAFQPVEHQHRQPPCRRSPMESGKKHPPNPSLGEQGTKSSTTGDRRHREPNGRKGRQKRSNRKKRRPQPGEWIFNGAGVDSRDAYASPPLYSIVYIFPISHSPFAMPSSCNCLCYTARCNDTL